MNNNPKVVLFMVDGMRPDGLMQAETSTMDLMRARGASTMEARTTFPSMTLPCHTSLFLGVPPERHGILTNTWMPQARPVLGLVDVLNRAEKQVAFFYNWENLRDLSRPGSLTASVMLRNLERPIPDCDSELIDVTLRWLLSHDCDFAFIYLGKTDVVGHDYGWMSQPYLNAIHHADRCINRITDALPPETTYLVMADHGGHAQTHGTMMDEDMLIPLLFQGPKIPKGKRLSHGASIVDVAPTILSIFGLTKPKEWVGNVLFA